MTDNNKSKLISWIIILLILASGYYISVFEELNLFFLCLLVAEILLVIVYNRKFNIAQITLIRIILGFVFIFSGFVKGVDPIGTEYRIIDYFIAFETDWAIPAALPLSVILNATEFVLGALLIFNVNIRLTSWLIMVMMAVFTVTTINDALYNPVKDCGCFGEAIILTNWQTFYKNLVIDALLIIVFIARNRTIRWFGKAAEWLILIIIGFGFLGFEIYNLRHLPAIDFRAWKAGNKMVNENPLPLKYYLIYKNKKTGEEKEYLSPDYPYNDSVWMSKWEFVRQRVVDPNPKIHDLTIEDDNGNDYTSQIIENRDYQFILVAYNLSETSLEKITQIRDFISQGINEDISFVVLTSSFAEEVMQFKQANNLEADFYFADDIELMTMIRSNPGLILLKDAVVIEKWHYNDFPTFKEFHRKFVDN
ncbi:MAG: DoxX family protein [Bacteroidetes bacterium]|nr:DoxX family protein [Bacteroidota bacterium]MBL7105289.1 DoxX family protein [Bacteroidales bacterium]